MTIAKRYRKKPVEVSAVKWDGSIQGPLGADEIEKWSSGKTKCRMVPPNVTHPYIFIETLEGEMRAEPGDYIVLGTHGEYYPVKPEIFEANNELVK